MILSDGFSDRHKFSTDNNEYASGINDENEWEENIVDYDVPLDERLDDYLDDSDRDDKNLYNETGFDPERID